MTPIAYIVWKTVAPEDIHVRRDTDFFPYHGYTEKDFQNLIKIAKAAEKILAKQTLGQRLSPIEKEALELYYGKDAPKLDIREDGIIWVGDGRHRMLALKEAGVCLRMPIRGALILQELKLEAEWEKEHIRNPEDFVLRRDSDFRYIVMERILGTDEQIRARGYHAIAQKDEQTGKEFLLIPRENIADIDRLSDDISDWKRNGMDIYVTKDMLRREIDER